jgi:hypothetical protein
MRNRKTFTLPKTTSMANVVSRVPDDKDLGAARRPGWRISSHTNAAEFRPNVRTGTVVR